jgi:hypothetical protein
MIIIPNVPSPLYESIANGKAFIITAAEDGVQINRLPWLKKQEGSVFWTSSWMLFKYSTTFQPWFCPLIFKLSSKY